MKLVDARKVISKLNKDNENERLKNTLEFLQISTKDRDSKSVLENNSDLFELYKMKKPGVPNENWVFNKISKKINSEIYYYHVDEVGYKRTKIKVKDRDNELFDTDKDRNLNLDKKVIQKMLVNGIDVTKSTVGVLGITFKENCPDVRNSKIIHVVSELKNWGVNVVVADPWANPVDVEQSYGITLGKVDSNHQVDTASNGIQNFVPTAG